MGVKQICLVVGLLLCLFLSGRARLSKPYGGSSAVYCDAAVRKQFEAAWQVDMDGRLRNGTWEYGFRIDWNWITGKLVIGELIMGDKEFHTTIPVNENTLAIAHVHGIAGMSTPSEIDMAEGRFPDYVISEDGLFVTIPNKHMYQFLRKFDQQFKSCQ